MSLGQNRFDMNKKTLIIGGISVVVSALALILYKSSQPPKISIVKVDPVKKVIHFKWGGKPMSYMSKQGLALKAEKSGFDLTVSDVYSSDKKTFQHVRFEIKKKGKIVRTFNPILHKW